MSALTFVDHLANTLRRARYWRVNGAEPPVAWERLQESEKNQWRAQAREVRGMKDPPKS